MDIITKAEAKRLGLKRYFTGKPCKYGHVAERFYSGDCTICQKKYREENREKLLARRREYYEENRDRELARRREYYEENRDREKARAMEYYEENRDREKARRSEYYEENRENLLARRKEYYEENRDKVLAQEKKYREELIDSYIKKTIRQSLNLQEGQISEDLMSLKREQLKLLRAIKEAKNGITRARD